MDRRGFLASSTASGLLAACATPGVPVASAGAACLPRVKVDRSRVIRLVAGPRPYRSSGFVVRAEPLGAKRLVHNYGHGGSGITLSWGSARLAVDLGLPDTSGPVAVLGAGIMGLSTARLAQERGRAVTIYAASLPPETTSNIAGGQIKPSLLYRSGAVDDAWRAQFAAALAYSWRRFQIMVGDDYGVRWLPTYEQDLGAPGGIDALVHAGSVELQGPANPFSAYEVRRYDTMYVEVGRYLTRLTEDFLLAGGRFVVGALSSPDQVAALPEATVFNCTGLGARDLFGDREMIPMRGQLAVLLPQPEVRYAYELPGGYMFSRPDGIILGGTYERGVEEAVTEEPAISRILAAHARLNSGCAS
ncbi:FAD-dependent oxidoreductase [Tsuneonella sp. HG222]